MKSQSHDREANSPRVTMRRIAGLDGLRAVAAGLVLVYHLIPGWADIGYVGVDVFFVLSGFLITSLLIVSLKRHGRVQLGDFWARRFRRLFPAVFVATISTAALAFIFGGDAQVGLGRQVAGSLTATYNWVEIAHGASYFQEASPLLLTNMWSLAVEQQFYLVWPLIVVLLVALPDARRVTVALAIAGISIALHIAFLGEDVTRSYMGTDTHLWGLMFGAALAFLKQSTVITNRNAQLPVTVGSADSSQQKATTTENKAGSDVDATPAVSALADGDDVPSSRLSALWGIGGWIGLISIVIGGIVLENTETMYPWGMVAASLAALLVVRSMLPDVTGAPVRALEGFLNSPVMVWLGVRSYGIYLWHWPLYVIAYYQYPLVDPLLIAPIIVALSILAADLSYRFVENPIRVMGVRGWFRHVRERIANYGALRAITVVTLPLVVVGLAVSGVATAPATSTGQQAVEAGNDPQAPNGASAVPPPPPAPEEDPGSSDDAPAPSEGPQPPEPSPAPSEDKGETDNPGSAHEPEEPNEDQDESTRDPNATYPTSWDQVTIIGDSVTLAAQYALQDEMPGVTVDAAESRSVQVAYDLIAQHAASGQLGDYVVVSLATNGTIKESQVEALLDLIGPDRTLVLVTGFGPARATWIPEANETIHAMSAKYPDRIWVADWNQSIKDHTDLLAGDVTHPGREGAILFAETIKERLEP